MLLILYMKPSEPVSAHDIHCAQECYDNFQQIVKATAFCGRRGIRLFLSICFAPGTSSACGYVFPSLAMLRVKQGIAASLCAGFMVPLASAVEQLLGLLVALRAGTFQ